MAAARELLGDLRVYQTASRNTRPVSPSDRLSHVVDLTLSTHQADFMVIEGGQLVGVLSRAAVLDALHRYGPDVAVAQVMCGDHPTVTPDETLLSAQQKMSTAACQALPVLENGQPVAL